MADQTLDEFLRSEARSPQEYEAAKRRAISDGADLSAPMRTPSRESAAPQSAVPQTMYRGVSAFLPPVPFPAQILDPKVAGDVSAEMRHQATEALPIVGGIGGGVLGGFLPVPGASIPLAGMGAAAGEKLRQTLQGEESDPGRVTTEGVLGLGGEAGAKWMFRVGSKLLAPMAGRYAEPEMQAIRSLAQRFGITLSPAEQTGSSALAQLESMPLRVPFGSQRMVDAKLAELETMETAAKRMGLPGEPPPSVVGNRLQGHMEAAQIRRRAAASRLYDEFERKAGDATLTAPTLAKVAGDISALEQSLKGVRRPRVATTSGGLTETTVKPTQEISQFDPASLGISNFDPSRVISISGPGIQSPVETVIQGMGLDTARPLTVQQARAIQSRLGAMIRESKNDYERGQLKAMFGAITDDIEAFADSLGPQVATSLKQANTFYRQEIGSVFDERSFIRHALNTDPEKVMGLVKSVSDVRSLRQAFKDDPAGNELLRRGWMQSVVDTASNKGYFSPAIFLSQVQKVQPEARAAILGNVTARELDNLVNVFRHQTQMSKAGWNPSETTRGLLGAEQVYGIVKFGLGTAAAAGAVATGAGIPAGLVTAGTILVTPNMLSRLLTSPSGIRWLTKGMQTPPGTETALRVGAQILANAGMPPSPAGKMWGEKKLSVEE